MEPNTETSMKQKENNLHSAFKNVSHTPINHLKNTENRNLQQHLWSIQPQQTKIKSNKIRTWKSISTALRAFQLVVALVILGPEIVVNAKGKSNIVKRHF